MKRTPLARVSKRRRRILADWELTKAAVWERDVSCRAQVFGLVGGCWGGGHVHHIRPRSRFPELICDLANVTLLCEGHHRQVHDDPKTARRLGLTA